MIQTGGTPMGRIHGVRITFHKKFHHRYVGFKLFFLVEALAGTFFEV